MKKNRIRWPESWTKSRKVLHGGLLYSQRDFIVSGGLFLLTVVLCMLLRSVDPHGDTSYVAVLFFLDVFLTALLTDGYLFSILIAVAGVLCVDYIFTEPYWEISFTLAGFPLTFIVMMFISVVTGMLTSRAKQLDALKREAERERIHANLLRAVSHDIRTPLTGIVGATEVNITLENAGKWARILVEDNGAGIPREELPYLFDASAHQSQQGDKKRNMGIGLSVCKTVVEAHGGTIRGENASPRGGARFVIELPMEDDDRENQG